MDFPQTFSQKPLAEHSDGKFQPRKWNLSETQEQGKTLKLEQNLFCSLNYNTTSASTWRLCYRHSTDLFTCVGFESEAVFLVLLISNAAEKTADAGSWDVLWPDLTHQTFSGDAGACSMQ